MDFKKMAACVSCLRRRQNGDSTLIPDSEVLTPGANEMSAPATTGSAHMWNSSYRRNVWEEMVYQKVDTDE